MDWDTDYSTVAEWMSSEEGTFTTFKKYGTYDLMLRLKTTGDYTIAGEALLNGKFVSGGKEYTASFGSVKEKSLTMSVTVNAYGNTISIVTDEIKCKVGVPYTGKIELSGVEEGDVITIDRNYGYATNLSFGTDGSITGTPTTAGTYTVEIRVWYNTNTLLAKKNVSVVIEDRTEIAVPDGKTLKYNGLEQTGVEGGTGYTLSGTDKATNVGSYSATATLEAGYIWANGSLNDKTINWKIEKGDKAAPTGITAENASNGASDGKIKGVSEEMEYKLASDSIYTPCTGTEITGLSKGTYHVRYKENENYNASPDFTIVVGEEGAVTYHVTVSDGTGTGIYVAGDTVTVTANAPVTGKEFDKWLAIGITLADDKLIEITFTMPECDVTLTATYKDIIYNVSVTGGNADKTTAKYGESVTVTADTPAIGKTFDKWVTTGITITTPTENSVTFSMPNGDVTLTATYKDIIYSVSVNNGNTDKTTAKYGESVTVTAGTTATGITFDKWVATGITLSDTDSKNPDLTFTMPAGNVTLTATYKKLKQYHIAVSGGSGSGYYNVGESVTVTANTPEVGKTFDKWTATGITLTDTDSKNPDLTFTMPECDVTLTATYKDIIYNVSVTNGNADKTTSKSGESVTVTANVPEEGKEFDGWYVNGVKVSSNVSYTFTVVEDIALEARYKNAETGGEHTHSYGSEWQKNADEHWNECACGDKANKAAHADENADDKCDICDYAMGTPEKTGLSGGAIAGIVVGSVAVVGLGGFALFWFVIKKKKFADLVALFKKK